MEIKIKYLTDVKKIKKIEQGDWIDLRCAKDMLIGKDEFALIPLGVAMELPKGYEAHVVPRSSTFNKWGLIQTNGMGIIDETYCGDNDEWFMPVKATRDIVLFKNDRVCQFRIMPKMNGIELTEVDNLENKDRGGFGSTGEN